MVSILSTLPHVEWNNAPNSVRIKKINGDVTNISSGDFISFSTYQSDLKIFFKVDEFVGNPNDIGPMYFVYREYDINTKKFIEPSFSLKMGNSSYIICYPAGISKYGYHLNNDEWASIAVCNLDNET
jgi:hypothetical protein